MVVSNSRAASFLEYLTVFRSRLAATSLVLPLVSFAYLPMETLLRKTRQAVEERVELNIGDPANSSVFNYLLEKGLIGNNPRRAGRYRGYTLSLQESRWAGFRGSTKIESLPVFKVDVWMSDQRLRSTIGAPTPENAAEIVDFAVQLRLISPAKGIWTAAGQLATQLRRQSAEFPGIGANPFVLGPELIVLARQVIEVDGLFLTELVRELMSSMGGEVRRDDFASARLGVVAGNVVQRLRALNAPLADVRAAKRYAELLSRKTAKARPMSTRSEQIDAAGVGVLEHRLSARLEWLVDLGALNKEGLAKNGFTYWCSPQLPTYLEELDAFVTGTRTSDDVALALWNLDPERPVIRASLSIRQALVEGYNLVRRSVGPAPIREVALGAAALTGSRFKPAELTQALLEWAASDSSAVSVSGGHYRREPEMVYLSGSASY